MKHLKGIKTVNVYDCSKVKVKKVTEGKTDIKEIKKDKGNEKKKKKRGKKKKRMCSPGDGALLTVSPRSLSVVALFRELSLLFPRALCRRPRLCCPRCLWASRSRPLLAPRSDAAFLPGRREGGWPPALSRRRSLRCSVRLCAPPRVGAPLRRWARGRPWNRPAPAAFQNSAPS